VKRAGIQGIGYQSQVTSYSAAQSKALKEALASHLESIQIVLNFMSFTPLKPSKFAKFKLFSKNTPSQKHVSGPFTPTQPTPPPTCSLPPIPSIDSGSDKDELSPPLPEVPISVVEDRKMSEMSGSTVTSSTSSPETEADEPAFEPEEADEQPPMLLMKVYRNESDYVPWKPREQSMTEELRRARQEQDEREQEMEMQLKKSKEQSILDEIDAKRVLDESKQQMEMQLKKARGVSQKTQRPGSPPDIPYRMVRSHNDDASSEESDSSSQPLVPSKAIKLIIREMDGTVHQEFNPESPIVQISPASSDGQAIPRAQTIPAGTPLPPRTRSIAVKQDFRPRNKSVTFNETIDLAHVVEKSVSAPADAKPEQEPVESNVDVISKNSIDNPISSWKARLNSMISQVALPGRFSPVAKTESDYIAAITETTSIMARPEPAKSYSPTVAKTEAAPVVARLKAPVESKNVFKITPSVAEPGPAPAVEKTVYKIKPIVEADEALMDRGSSLKPTRAEKYAVKNGDRRNLRDFDLDMILADTSPRSAGGETFEFDFNAVSDIYI
jgi:hypothetical protein